MRKILWILLVLGLPLLARADEHNAVGNAKKAVQAVKEGATRAGEAAKNAVIAAEAAPQAVLPAVGANPLSLVVNNATHHMHNKLVHFPLALGCFGLFFLLLTLKWPGFLASARLSLVTALITGLAALTTGGAMEEHFVPGPKAETFEAHERFAQGSMVLLALALLLSFMPSLRKVWWLVALLGIGALLFTGGLGGVLAHTR